MAVYNDLLNEYTFASDSTTTTDMTTDTLTVNTSATFPYLNRGVVGVSGTGVMFSTPLATGQIILGRTGLDPLATTIQGTVDRVTVVSDITGITISGPQDIATTSSPTFAMVTANSLRIMAMSGGTPIYGSIVWAPGSANRTFTLPNTNGTFIMSTGNISISGTKNFSQAIQLSAATNQIQFNNATDSIWLNASRPTAGTGAAIYNLRYVGASADIMMTEGNYTVNGNLSYSSLTASTLVSASAGKVLQSTTLAGTNGLSLGFAGSTLTADLLSSATPTITGLTLSGLTASTMLSASGTKGIQSTTLAGTNGLSLGFAGSTLTADLLSSATPTITGLTLSGLTASTLVFASAGKVLQSTTLAGGNGVTLGFAGSTLTAALDSTAIPTVASAIMSNLTASTLVACSGTKQLQSVPIESYNGCDLTYTGYKLVATMTQNLAAAGSPTFAGVTMSGLTASTLLSSNGSKGVQSTTITNANGCAMSFSGSTLTASMSQDLSSTATPTFASVITTAGHATMGVTCYQVGTVTQSGTTITGIGTTFTAAMVGGLLMASGGVSTYIKTFTNATSLIVSTTATFTTGRSYTIFYDASTTAGAYAVGKNGNVFQSVYNNPSVTDVTVAHYQLMSSSGGGNMAFDYQPYYAVSGNPPAGRMLVRDSNYGVDYWFQSRIQGTDPNPLQTIFCLNGDKSVTTFNNTLDNGSGTMTVGQLIDSGLTASTMVSCNGSKQLQTTTLAGGNGVTLGFAGSTLTAALDSSASPTVAGLTVSGMSASALTYTNASKQLGSVTLSYANGAFTSLTGSLLLISNMQDLAPAASPTFVNTTFSGTTANTLLAVDTNKRTTSVTTTSSNGITLGYNAGVLAVGSLQDLRTTAVPSFSHVVVTNSVYLTASSTTSVTPGSFAIPLYTTISLADPSGMYNPANARFTISSNGQYRVEANIRFVDQATAVSGDSVGIAVYRNGTNTTNESFSMPDGVGRRAADLNCLLGLLAGDYIQIAVYQNSGATVDMSKFHFAMYKVAI